MQISGNKNGILTFGDGIFWTEIWGIFRKDSQQRLNVRANL
jgi:hypothetical protein